MSMTTKII